MTTDSQNTYDSSASPSLSPEPRPQLSRILSSIGRPRGFSFNARVVVTVSTAIVAFWPVWTTNMEAMLAGSPVAYLFLGPVWAVMITYSLDQTPRGKEINDAEFDRIVTVVIGAIGIICASVLTPRLPAATAFWHADVIAPLLWIFCASIMAFGIRRVVRDYLTWTFVAACFPPIFLLAGKALGGSTFAFGVLTVFYGAVAAFLTLRGSALKWVVPPAFLAVGAAGTWLVRDLPAPVVYLVPTFVLTLAVIALMARRVHIPTRISLPPRSVLSGVVAFVLALVVLGTAPRPLALADPDNLIWAQSDWVDELTRSGVAVGAPQTFDWGPGFMGDDGSVTRHRVQIGDDVAFLDVFSSTDLGRFTSFRRGIWYSSAPPVAMDAEYRGNGKEITQFGSFSNALDTATAADQSLWTARYWTWRVTVGSETHYQVVYLLGSRMPDEPDNVTEPAALTFASTVLQPIEWLMIASTSSTGTRTDFEPPLTTMATIIVNAAQDRR